MRKRSILLPVMLMAAFFCLNMAEDACGQKSLWLKLNARTLKLERQGKYEEAYKAAKRALEVAERTFGPDHTEVATALNNMATVCQARSRYAETERLFKRALDIERKSLGPNHLRVATSLNNLGLLYSELGRYPEAEKLLGNGFLRMSEVMSLKMNAGVVALSACQTGLGRRISGEGVVGMGRAFQYAGAKAVLMSLWSVAEDSSVKLVESFFRRLKEGKGKLEALKLARKELREAGYDHPFFWAAFILVGEAR